MEPKSIKSIIEKVIVQADMSEKIEECKALFLWKDVAPNLVARTKAVGISRGRMSVNVTDSVVLHQLTFYKKKYIDKINLMLGKRMVKDIIFRVGNVQKRKKIIENRDDYMDRFLNTELDQDELSRIDDIVSQVEDQEIRDSLRELFINQGKLSKIRDADDASNKTIP